MKNKSTNNAISRGDLSKVTTYQAGVMQAATHRILQKHCDLILRQYGITKMQWLIIGSVLDADDKGMRLTELTAILGTTMSYVTTAVNLLESKGILTRKDNSNDSRSKFISINPAFEPKCEEIEKTLRQALRKSIYANISPEDFRTYMKVLYQLSSVEDSVS